MNVNPHKFPQWKDCDLTPDDFPHDPLPEVDDSELANVLREIFSVDPQTGLPKGDVQYFMSSEGNPVVKQWLEQNLLQPRAKQTGSSIEGVTDDMIVEMSRQSGESVEAYQSRLTSLYESAQAEYQKSLEQLKTD